MPKANADSVSDATPLDKDGAVVRRADGTLTEVVIPSDRRATDVAAAEPPRKRDEPAKTPDEIGTRPDSQGGEGPWGGSNSSTSTLKTASTPARNKRGAGAR